jgi:hypothetical protein
MNSVWQDDFRSRMNDFGHGASEEGITVSIKVRASSGCFHREHSPAAFEIIDNKLQSPKLRRDSLSFQEHESGPEIIVYLAVLAAGLNLTTSLVNLVTAIIKARSEGVKKGDRPDEAIDVIVRGYTEDGQYFEGQILRLESKDKVTSKAVEVALRSEIEKHLPGRKKVKW